MSRTLRSLVPWIFAAAAILSIAWAINRGTLPRADFTFCNGTEVKSFDPSIVAGMPENRICNALFEGLVRWAPDDLEPIPGIADRWEISPDSRVYTFHIRPTARWSDGTPITAEDYRYSLRRFLDPRTAAEYAYQAWYIVNARRYSGGADALKIGDKVEVELNLPTNAINTLRGEVLHGALVDVQDVNAPVEERTFVVEIDGRRQRFCYADDAKASGAPPADGTRWCRQVLLDFNEVGIQAVDKSTVRYTLENPTHHWLNLLGFYPLFAVNSACVEKYGSPHWTYPENIVCSGAYKPLFRRIRDRTRLVKNEHYWDRDNVQLSSIDVLASESVNTMLNLFLTGQSDWNYDIPPAALKVLLAERPKRDDVNPQPFLTTYYYLLNTTRKGLDDVRVRQALSMALDRDEITRQFLGAGEQTAYSITPPWIAGYSPPTCAKENAAEARRLLAEAGYPNGRGFPSFTILYNTHESHQAIAELVRKQWQRQLGISVRSRNEEFVTYLASQRLLKYDISRRAWVADYADPNSFLGMFVTGGEQNCTGWGSPEYDRLIRDAEREPNAKKRFAILADAERMLMDQMPIIPVYFYVSKSMVQPYVRGFWNNFQDTHPLSAIWIDRTEQSPNPFLENRR